MLKCQLLHSFLMLVAASSICVGLPQLSYANKKPAPIKIAKKKSCTEILKLEELPLHETRVRRAKELIKKDLAEHAYVAQWEFKISKGQGPYAKQGEALIVGLTNKNEEKWMREIGSRSIGLMIAGLPEEANSTAFLRIGNKFYSEDRLRYGRGHRDFLEDVLQKFDHTAGYTEATFIMTAEEIELIQEFFDSRGKQQIIAQFDIDKIGPRKGQAILPVWTHTGQDLIEESCAAAVTSFLDEDWLIHYDKDKAARLRKIGKRLNLKWTFVARRLIWENFRNPQTSFITLHRIDSAPKNGVAYMKDFMGQLGWGSIRGLYSYAFIPDNPQTSSNKFRSSRISLPDFVAR